MSFFLLDPPTFELGTTYRDRSGWTPPQTSKIFTTYRGRSVGRVQNWPPRMRMYGLQTGLKTGLQTYRDIKIRLDIDFTHRM